MTRSAAIVAAVTAELALHPDLETTDGLRQVSFVVIFDQKDRQRKRVAAVLFKLESRSEFA